MNAAERAIQTFKNHFISGLYATDENWSLQLWDQLTHQATITLNLLRMSRIDPTKSLYEQIHSAKYDWNKHPMAPPGTRAIMYEAPDSRASWGPRGTETWYYGPELDHYRNCKFYVPEIHSYRTSGSFYLFPQHCLLPKFIPTQRTNEVQDELMGTIQKLEAPAKKLILAKLGALFALRRASVSVQVFFPKTPKNLKFILRARLQDASFDCLCPTHLNLIKCRAVLLC